MNLKNLAVKPQLIKLTLDDEDIVLEYGEPLDFYTWDRQPMDAFLKIATSNSGNFLELATVLKDMILDEEGNPVIQGEVSLPGKVLVASLTKLVGVLGK